MKKVIYLGVLVLLLTSTGCIATKDYVLEQTGPLSRRVIDLESRMSALENMVNRIPATDHTILTSLSLLPLNCVHKSRFPASAGTIVTDVRSTEISRLMRA